MGGMETFLGDHCLATVTDDLVKKNSCELRQEKKTLRTTAQMIHSRQRPVICLQMR